MRNIVVFAAVLLVSGVVMGEVADQWSSARLAKAAATPVTTGLANPGASRTAFAIPRDSRGHFQTDARIDGQRLSVMVDTGASLIALTESAAARVGLRPAPSAWRAIVSTANGKVKAAPVRLASVDVGGIVVRDVDAVVLPDEALGENLLGLSYLSRLKRFEYADGRLMLEN
jgi:aspartyl protease family protein